MKCPIDDSPLSVSSREGVEIDFCPQCRGVWLDRGELDKIIDRAATTFSGAAPSPSYAAPEREPSRRPRLGRRRPTATVAIARKRKKRSFLDDLFEFD